MATPIGFTCPGIQCVLTVKKTNKQTKSDCVASSTPLFLARKVLSCEILHLSTSVIVMAGAGRACIVRNYHPLHGEVTVYAEVG